MMERKNFIKNFQILKNVVQVVFIILICFILTSCLEVKQEITVDKDGSGNTRLEIAIQKEMLFDPQMISEFKNELKEEGWNILDEVEREGGYVITAGRKFKDISELNDDEGRYIFSSEKMGFIKKSYILEIEHIENSEIPFPYEIYIKVPGSIDETDGEKVSSNKVKWNLQGFSRGTVLSVKSSGFTIPALAWLAIVIVVLLSLFVAVVVVSKIIKPVAYKSKVVSKTTFCAQCGKENPESANFCTTCGEKL